MPNGTKIPQQQQAEEGAGTTTLAKRSRYPTKDRQGSRTLPASQWNARRLDASPDHLHNLTNDEKHQVGEAKSSAAGVLVASVAQLVTDYLDSRERRS